MTKDSPLSAVAVVLTVPKNELVLAVGAVVAVPKEIDVPAVGDVGSVPKEAAVPAVGGVGAVPALQKKEAVPTVPAVTVHPAEPDRSEASGARDVPETGVGGGVLRDFKPLPSQKNATTTRVFPAVGD